MSTSLIVPEVSKDLRGKTFVYVDRRPTGEPFYVGIGNYDRLRTRKRYGNRHHTDIVNKHDGCWREIICVTESRERANQIEMSLIARHGRLLLGTGILINRSAGGDGYVDPTPEARAARSKAMKGRKIVQPQGAWRKGVEAARRANVGNTHTLGMKFSEEIRARMSAASKGRPKSEAMKAKLRGRKLSEEHRASVVAAKKARDERIAEFLRRTGCSVPHKMVTNKLMNEWGLGSSESPAREPAAAG